MALEHFFRRFFPLCVDTAQAIHGGLDITVPPPGKIFLPVAEIFLLNLVIDNIPEHILEFA